MGDVILCNISDANQLIIESREQWLAEILLGLGVSQEILNMAQTNIQEFRFQMEGLGVEVDLKTTGEVDVFKKIWHEDAAPEKCGWLPTNKSCLVAQWREPKKIRRVEGKDVYYEIQLNNWSVLNSRF